VFTRRTLTLGAILGFLLLALKGYESWTRSSYKPVALNKELVTESRAAPKVAPKIIESKKPVAALSEKSYSLLDMVQEANKSKNPIEDFFRDSINFREWSIQDRIYSYLADFDEANEPSFKISCSADIPNYRLIYILTSVPSTDANIIEPSLYYYFQMQAYNAETGGITSLAAQSGRIESLRIRNDQFWVTSPVFGESLLKDYSQIVASVPTLEEANGELRYLDKNRNELTPPVSFQWGMDAKDFDPWNW
jgi:hypothetical protein